jgi:hypothetical protein
VVGLGREVLDRLGKDPGARREDEVVIGESLAISELDQPPGFVDPLDLPDHQRDPAVEQPALGTAELRGMFAAHGDVHEAGLIHVLADLIDDRDRDFTGRDAAAEALHEEVGGERPTDAATQDQDPLHGCHLSGSSRRRSRRNPRG